MLLAAVHTSAQNVSQIQLLYEPVLLYPYMIVTLTGSNAFLLGVEQRKAVADFSKKYGETAIERIDGSGVSPAQLKSMMQSGSLFSTNRMILVTGVATNKLLGERIEDVLKADSQDIELIFIEPKFDKRSILFKTLKKNTEFHEYSVLDETSLSRWVVESTKQQGGIIDSSDARYLVQRVGTDQLRLSNELAKLVTYKSQISRHSIDELTQQTPQSTTFSLLDAAFSGNSKLALKIYEEQRKQKVEPQAIMGMIAWQLHILALVKAASQRGADEIAAQAKVSPFVVRKTMGLARGISLTDIKKLVSRTLLLDIRLKKDAIDADDAIKQLLLEITS